MSAQQRELLRVAILMALEASGSYTPTLAVLRTSLRVGGYPDVTEEQIKAELLYLRDKTFAATVEKQISPEIAKWRITAAGRDHLATEGLA